MRKLCFYGWLLASILCAQGLRAQEEKDLSKIYEVVSQSAPVAADALKDFNNMIFYRFGWNRKGPPAIALQFVNFGYKDRKLKFAIKDVTSKKMVILDPAGKSPFATEDLKESSRSAIWSGPVDNIHHRFSLRVWEDDGDEIDEDPVSINEKNDLEPIPADFILLPWLDFSRGSGAGIRG